LRATGPWALFRLFTPPFARNAKWSGQVLSASLVVDGQIFSFDVTAASSENPIGLPALRDFKCPSDL
jgi:type VI secretion system protein ImpL